MPAAVVPAPRARWKIDDVPTSDPGPNHVLIVGSQQNGREYLYEPLDYVAKGKVKVMAETYRLADVNRAYDRVAEGKVRFRAVITDA